MKTNNTDRIEDIILGFRNLPEDEGNKIVFIMVGERGSNNISSMQYFDYFYNIADIVRLVYKGTVLLAHVKEINHEKDK